MSPGDMLVPGDTIGVQGETGGRATGRHVHIESPSLGRAPVMDQFVRDLIALMFEGRPPYEPMGVEFEMLALDDQTDDADLKLNVFDPPQGVASIEAKVGDLTVSGRPAEPLRIVHEIGSDLAGTRIRVFGKDGAGTTISEGSVVLKRATATSSFVAALSSRGSPGMYKASVVNPPEDWQRTEVEVNRPTEGTVNVATILGRALGNPNGISDANGTGNTNVPPTFEAPITEPVAGEHVQFTNVKRDGSISGTVHINPAPIQ